jgi:hypothetical protein
MRRLRLSFAGLPDATDAPLSVDGMTERGPNLSHWPGNRTPTRFKADLSTGICLRFARAPTADRERFLGETEVVLNDHYDTDGFLSLLAVLRPEVALAREEVCLLAAATGDFQSFQTERAFAIDRIVANLGDTARSSRAADFAHLAGGARSLARYRWLLENAAAVLDAPQAFAALYRDELAAVQSELDAARAGALDRRVHHALGFAVLRSRQPLQRMVLNTLAAAWRVLHVQDTTDGPLYRYHDRTESWFEVVTFAPPPRRDLRPLARRLQELEADAGGAAGVWCADAPTEPVPELYHGAPAPQEYGRVTRVLAPSCLTPDQVEAAFAAHFAEPPP